MTNPTTAFVKLWNKKVGAIAWNEQNQLGEFEFDPTFLTHSWDIAPITMLVNSPKGTVFSFPELRANNTFRGLPGLLADLLPDR